jgi:hypothetical protein
MAEKQYTTSEYDADKAKVSTVDNRAKKSKRKRLTKEDVRRK